MKDADRDPVLLEYVAESIDLVEEYSEVGWDHFRLSQIHQDAALRRLETLADAASKLSAELKARHPEVPWRRIHDFRNVAAHGYLHIELDRIWELITAHLPALKAAVEAELSQLEQ